MTTYNSYRRKTRCVNVGGIYIGGDAPLTVQSMTNTDTLDFDATLRQTNALAEAGCDIVRLAVPSREAAGIIARLKASGVKVPLVADIHFDYKTALACVKAGADKIRINPGNIGAPERVHEVASACKNAGIPIRIGVNTGSLDRDLVKKYGSPTPEALAESALRQAQTLEDFGFSDIVISLKASTVRDMIKANRILADKCDYPLHLGVTEAGDETSGTVKNSAGIGSLLCDGIGDTLRVSLTADPIREVAVGREILHSLSLDAGGIDIVSCPSCGRTKIDIITLAAAFKEASKSIDTHGKRVKVAIMGCAVNGPGEAADADLGIAGGRGEGLLFIHGEIIRKVSEDEIVGYLCREVEKFLIEQ